MAQQHKPKDMMRILSSFVALLFCAQLSFASPADDLVLQGQKALENRDVATALKDFTEALEADPNNAKAAYHRGRINLVLHKHAQAIADFTSAVLSDPKMGVALSARGEAKIAAKDVESAFSDFDKAIVVSPDVPEVFVIRATYRLQRKDIEGAKSDLQSALAVADENTSKMLKVMIERLNQ